MANGKITVLGARQFQKMIFGRTAEQLDNYYLALCSEEPSVFDIGSELIEPDAETGYVRAEIPNNIDWWGENAASTLTNLQEILFAPAVMEWGQQKYWALCNAEVEGEVYMIGDLATPIEVSPLDQVVVPSGTLSVGITILFQAK